MIEIIEESLEYKLKFSNLEEAQEVLQWCIDNKDNVERFSCYLFPNSNHRSGTIEFKCIENATAFKLKWS